VSVQFGGDAATTYDVTLRVRGVMEGYWYSGGVLDPKSKTFYTGGVPTIGGFSTARIFVPVISSQAWMTCRTE